MIRVTLKREVFELALTRRNLSQKKLAVKIGISRSYLCEIVGGKRPASAYVRELLLGYFKDYTFDDFFRIEGNGDGRSENH